MILTKNNKQKYGILKSIHVQACMNSITEKHM